MNKYAGENLNSVYAYWPKVAAYQQYRLQIFNTSGKYRRMSVLSQLGSLTPFRATLNAES